MYGYVKTGEGELKMREYELYRAFYCGLCREMGRTTGQSSRASLSYDAVFLAIVRCAVLGERVNVDRGRCFVHPMHKRLFVDSSDSLRFAAAASATLVRFKLDDSRADERGAKRLAASIASPIASLWRSRASKLTPSLEDIVRDHLLSISRLESAHCNSIDEVSATFGALLGDVASYGTNAPASTLLRSIGDLVGRFVYICDACDDAARDFALGRYNPLVELYGAELCEKRLVTDLRAKTAEREVICRSIGEQIKSAAMMILVRLDSAIDLVDFTVSPQLEGIVRNIVRVGMPGQLRRALGMVTEPTFAESTDETQPKEHREDNAK